MTLSSTSSDEAVTPGQRRTSVLPIEWLALSLIVLALGATGFSDPLVDWSPFGMLVGAILLSSIALLFAGAGLFWAASDRLNAAQRVRTAVAMPLAACVVFTFGSPVQDFGRKILANRFLARHTELVAIQPIIDYRNGVLGGNQYLVADAARPRFVLMTKQQPVEWLPITPGWHLVITD